MLHNELFFITLINSYELEFAIKIYKNINHPGYSLLIYNCLSLIMLCEYIRHWGKWL